MTRILLFAAALLALAIWLVPPGAEVSGRARVVDGDTFWIGDTKIRLFGIDAPEAAAPMGPAATQWLLDFVAGRDVACRQRDTDRYGRMVATCTAGGADIAEAMTAAGMAQAYRRFSSDYIDEEDAARAAGTGIWQASAPSAPACAIKGNISSGGRYYHLPGTRAYDGTRIDTSRGERWFCTEAEARAAGWQPVP